MEFVEVLPFSVEGPPSLHYDDFQHVLDEVVELMILLNEGPDDLDIHDGWIAESNVRHVERFGRTDVFA